MYPKDPNILLSFINLKLRDYYDSLDMLCDDLDYSKEDIISILSKIDYYYDEDNNQFKRK